MPLAIYQLFNFFALSQRLSVVRHFLTELCGKLAVIAVRPLGAGQARCRPWPVERPPCISQRFLPREPKTLTSRAAVPVTKPFAPMQAHRIRCSNPQEGAVFEAPNDNPLGLNNVQTRNIKPGLEKAGLSYPWHGWHAAPRLLCIANGVEARAEKQYLSRGLNGPHEDCSRCGQHGDGRRRDPCVADVPFTAGTGR
jgi:hypothetical protein